RPDPPGDVLQQHPVADGHGRVDQVEDVLAQPGRGEADQLDLVARRRLTLDERVGRLDPEARLACPGGRTAPQPRQLLARQVAPAGVPRRSHAIYVRVTFARRSSVSRASRSRSAFVRTLSVYPPSYVCTCPSGTSLLRVDSSSRN